MDISFELILITAVSAYLWRLKNQLVVGTVNDTIKQVIPDKYLNMRYLCALWVLGIGVIFYHIHGEDNANAIWNYHPGYSWVGYGHIGPNIRNILFGIAMAATLQMGYEHDGELNPNTFGGWCGIWLAGLWTMLPFAIFFWSYTPLLVGLSFAWIYRIESLLSGKNAESRWGDYFVGGIIGMYLYYYNFPWLQYV